MMSLQRNYYEVLGLPPGATTDQIKKKYRELARKFHPDVVQDKTMGQRVFTQINQAYSVLGDPERRAQYNGTLIQTEAPRASAPASSAAPAPPPPSAAALDPAFAARKAQQFTDMLSRAENAIMAGKPIEARAFCVRILEADPRQVRALEVLGDALIQMGRKEEAAVQYRRALEVAPSTLIQAKLNRVAQGAMPIRTLPPTSSAQTVPPRPAPSRPAPSQPAQAKPTPTKSAPERTNPPANAEPEKPGSLLSRLLGRK